MNLSEESVTILKYRVDDIYDFFVMDKFDEPDEVKRLDRIMESSRHMRELYGEDHYEELWIKTCPIFPVS